MSEHFHEQVSEFIDDEMSVEESEFFVRRLQRDESARRRYLRYQLIGAAVRGEYLHPGASDLGRRLEQALSRDEAAANQSGSRWVRLVSGTGIAASVVLVAIFGFVMLGPGSPASGGSRNAADEPRVSIISPAVVDPTLVVRAQNRVTGIQYMMHHARYSSSMFRTIMQSNVVAAQETDPADELQEPTLE